jgi:hypothetical protein
MPWGLHRAPANPSEGSTVDRPVSRHDRRRATTRRHRRQFIGVVCALVLVSVAGEAIRVRTANPSPSRGSAAPANRKGGRKAATSTTTTIVAATQHDSPGGGDVFDVPAVASYLSGTSQDVTAAVYDDVTGVTSVYRPGVAQDTASIVKVDILATLLAQGQADGQGLAPADGPIATGMIEQSDNDDAQDLWDNEGGATAVGTFDTTAGLTQTDPDAAGYWGLTTTTAADQVQLVRAVAYPNAILTPASQSYELNLMEHVDPDQSWGVSAGVAAGSTVALKNGWLPLDSGGWQVDSIGYVNGDGRDYVIAVLTTDDNEADGINFIQGLSGLIWQELAPTSS